MRANPREANHQSNPAPEQDLQSAVNDFLDRNGYTAREVRGIAMEAILRWVAQQS